MNLKRKNGLWERESEYFSSCIVTEGNVFWEIQWQLSLNNDNFSSKSHWDQVSNIRNGCYENNAHPVH